MKKHAIWILVIIAAITLYFTFDNRKNNETDTETVVQETISDEKEISSEQEETETDKTNVTEKEDASVQENAEETGTKEKDAAEQTEEENQTEQEEQSDEQQGKQPEKQNASSAQQTTEDNQAEISEKENLAQKDTISSNKVTNVKDNNKEKEPDEKDFPVLDDGELIVQLDSVDDGNPNTENWNIVDKDGVAANVQIGIVEADVMIPDAPDTSGVNTNDKNQTKPGGNASFNDGKTPSRPQYSGVPGSGWKTTYQEYEAMTGTEQTLFYYSFADADDFLEWYNRAKEAYESGKDEIYIGLDGVVNVGDGD